MQEDTGVLKKLVTLGLIAVLVVAPTQYGVEVAKKAYISPVDPLIWLVTLLWFIDVLRSRGWSSVKWPPLFSLLFIAMAVVSWLKAIPSLKSFKDVFQLVEYFVAAYMLFVSHFTDLRLLRKAVTAVLVVATVVLTLGLIHYWNPSTQAFNVRATFLNRNVLGGYLALMLPLFFGLMLYDSRWIQRIWCLIVVIAGLCVTLSGGTLIALTLALGILAMMKSQKAFAVLAAASLIIATLASPLLPRNNGAILYNSIRLYDDSNEVSRRYTEWEAAATMTLENPWAGVGIGNYQDNIGGYYGSLPRPPGTTSEHDSQNLYLVIASSAGIVGLLAFLGMLIFFAVQAASAYYRTVDPWFKGLSLGLFGSILAFSINSIWSPLLVRGIGVPLVFVLSLSAVVGASRNSGQSVAASCDRAAGPE